MVKFKMIQHPPDPKGFLAWLYQSTLPNFGEPLILTYDGNNAYNWPIKDQKLGFKHYVYIAFSDWFQDDAAYSTTEILREPSSRNLSYFIPSILSFTKKHPKDLIEDKIVRPKFKQLLQSGFDRFITNISVASTPKQKGDFLFGEGCAPHSCTWEGSAFCIDIYSGEVFVAILHNDMIFYSGNNISELPIPLQDWINHNYRKITDFRPLGKNIEMLK